jgi:hypothetical protein
MVKCADCGFLAARNRQDRQLEEAESIMREKGIPAVTFSSNAVMGIGTKHEGEPLCFVQANDLRKEFWETTHREHPTYQIVDSDSIVEVLLRDRECKDFVKWQQGFTPKEHREMLDRLEQRRWQEGREDTDRKWRSKQDKNLVIIAGLFTILGAVIGAVIAVFAK